MYVGLRPWSLSSVVKIGCALIEHGYSLVRQQRRAGHDGRLPGNVLAAAVHFTSDPQAWWPASPRGECGPSTRWSAICWPGSASRGWWRSSELAVVRRSGAPAWAPRATTCRGHTAVDAARLGHAGVHAQRMRPPAARLPRGLPSSGWRGASSRPEGGSRRRPEGLQRCGCWQLGCNRVAVPPRRVAEEPSKLSSSISGLRRRRPDSNR